MPDIKRAYVMVAMGIEDDLSLKVKSIVVYSERVQATDLSELFFEWFSITGWNYPKAHQNAVESIAFYVSTRPDMREALLRACAPILRDEVMKALEG